MVVAAFKLSKVSIANRTRVAAVFFLGGLASGLISAWLGSNPKLRSFLFVKGDKFLIPTYRFWIAFGLIFSLGLAIAYLISYSYRWLATSPSTARQLSALFVVAASPVVLYFSTHATFFIAAIYYVVFLPLSMCIITQRLRLLALAVRTKYLRAHCGINRYIHRFDNHKRLVSFI